MKIIYDDGELEIVIFRGKSKKSFVFGDNDEAEQIYKGIEAYRDTVSELADDITNLKMEFEVDEKSDC